MEIIERINAFEKLGLGLFVHWGLYAKESRGEWSQNILVLPDYQAAFHEFNPDNANLKQLVTQAVENGFKYIVLTAKHHEGFYLFDTKGHSKFDSQHTPYGGDAIQIFVQACHQAGIKPFLYFATYDWHDELYQHDFKAYLAKMRQMIELLCTNYGEIGGFWFDGNWDKPDADWEETALYQLIREKQPNALIINNTGLEEQGAIRNPLIDVLTFERGNPQSINHQGPQKYLAAETSMTVNKHWGVAKNDINYVSPKQLIDQICNSRKVGANLLINTGLEFDGAIPAFSQSLLKIVGQWMSVYGEAIYATNHYENQTYLASGETTDFIKGNYLFVYGLGNIGNSNVVLGGEKAREIVFNQYPQRVTSITWLDNQALLEFEQASDGTLTIYANAFQYGTHLIDRVATITVED